ncbi:Velvet domain containing protein, partial [Pyrenophora tritici-repentis]
AYNAAAIIRLIVYDRITGRADFNDIDSTYFVLMVDLWNQEGTAAVNLVRHSSSTVSISSSTTTSYPPPPDRRYVTTAIPQYDPPYRMTTHMPSYSHGPVMGYPYPQPGPPASYPASNHAQNLIGMNAVNACRLNDLDGKAGFWFVLQDLGVRTGAPFDSSSASSTLAAAQTVVPESGPTRKWAASNLLKASKSTVPTAPASGAANLEQQVHKVERANCCPSNSVYKYETE